MTVLGVCLAIVAAFTFFAAREQWQEDEGGVALIFLIITLGLAAGAVRALT